MADNRDQRDLERAEGLTGPPAPVKGQGSNAKGAPRGPRTPGGRPPVKK